MWYNGKQIQEKPYISWEVLQDKTALDKWSNLVLTNQSDQDVIENGKGVFRTEGFTPLSNKHKQQDSYLGNIIKATAV